MLLFAEVETLGYQLRRCKRGFSLNKHTHFRLCVHWQRINSEYLETSSETKQFHQVPSFRIVTDFILHRFVLTIYYRHLHCTLWFVIQIFSFLHIYTLKLRWKMQIFVNIYSTTEHWKMLVIAASKTSSSSPGTKPKTIMQFSTGLSYKAGCKRATRKRGKCFHILSLEV